MFRLWAVTLTTVYDNDGRVTLTTYNDNTTSSTIYDPLGRRTSATDQDSLTTSYIYDNLGRLCQQAYKTEPLAGVKN